MCAVVTAINVFLCVLEHLKKKQNKPERVRERALLHEKLHMDGCILVLDLLSCAISYMSSFTRFIGLRCSLGCLNDKRTV
jgi:hypothetical protein